MGSTRCATAQAGEQATARPAMTRGMPPAVARLTAMTVSQHVVAASHYG